MEGFIHLVCQEVPSGHLSQLVTQGRGLHNLFLVCHHRVFLILGLGPIFQSKEFLSHQVHKPLDLPCVLPCSPVLQFHFPKWVQEDLYLPSTSFIPHQGCHILYLSDPPYHLEVNQDSNLAFQEGPTKCHQSLVSNLVHTLQLDKCQALVVFKDYHHMIKLNSFLGRNH